MWMCLWGKKGEGCRRWVARSCFIDFVYLGGGRLLDSWILEDLRKMDRAPD